MKLRPKSVEITTTESQIDSALDRATLYDAWRPRAVAAAYLAKKDAISLKLANGVQIAIPRRLLQGLQNATPSAIAKVEVTDLGSVLHWPMLGVDHYIPSLCEGVLGTRKWMASIAGAKGGKARTPAKVEASRLNGRNGGRPKSNRHK